MHLKEVSAVALFKAPPFSLDCHGCLEQAAVGAAQPGGGGGKGTAASGIVIKLLSIAFLIQRSKQCVVDYCK